MDIQRSDQQVSFEKEMHEVYVFLESSKLYVDKETEI